MKIAYIYDCQVNKSDIMQLIASTIMGSFSKQAYKVAITAMKGLGWLGGPILETNYMKSIETDGFAEKLLRLRKGIRIYT